jgi:hypothetical protein
LLSQFLCVYLHASPSAYLLARVTTRLLDKTANQLVLEFGHVQCMLKGILSEHDVVIDAGLIDGNGEEELTALVG